MRGVVLTILLMLFLCSGATLQAQDYKPGWTKKIPLPKASHGSIDLYLPSTYGKEADRAYPVIFMSWPDGKPPADKLEPWAERRQFIIMGLNGSKNGPYEPNRLVQESALDLVKKLKASPNLIFTIGFSGGAQSGWGFTVTFTGHGAGMLMIGQGGWDQMPAKHIPVAYLYGNREGNKRWINMMTGRLERQGNPVKHQEIPGGHVFGKNTDWFPLLDWLYFTALFTNPTLSAADKAIAETLISDRLAKFDALKDDEKISETESLLSIPNIARRKDVAPMAEAWFKLKLAQAEKAESNPVEAYYLVDELLTHSLAKHKGVNKTDYKSASTLKRKLLKDKGVKKEASASKILAKVIALHSKLPTNAPASRVKQVKEGYQMLIDKYAGTRAATTAQQRLSSMEDKKKK